MILVDNSWRIIECYMETLEIICYILLVIACVYLKIQIVCM